jgi:hypothetical protein
MDFNYFQTLKSQAKLKLHSERNKNKGVRKINLAFYSIDNQNADMVGLCNACVQGLNSECSKDCISIFTETGKMIASAVLECFESAWILAVDCVFSFCWFQGRKMDNYPVDKKNQ